MGMRKTMKRKHMETKGLGGGRCGRDRMFYISSSMYRGHTPCGQQVAELAGEQDYAFPLAGLILPHWWEEALKEVSCCSRR